MSKACFLCVFFAPDLRVRDVAAHLSELKGMSFTGPPIEQGLSSSTDPP